MQWEVYIIQTENEKFYTGIANDVERRFYEHLDSKKGARFFRTDKPVTVVYREECLDRSDALKKEASIKKLCKQDKIALIDKRGFYDW